MTDNIQNVNIGSTKGISESIPNDINKEKFNKSILAAIMSMIGLLESVVDNVSNNMKKTDEESTRLREEADKEIRENIADKVSDGQGGVQEISISVELPSVDTGGGAADFTASEK